MKRFNYKIITLAAIALSAILLQGCVATITKELIMSTVASDVGADAIRTSFSRDDFGLIDDGLKGKKSVYIGFNTLLGEINANKVCSAFKDKYNCQVVLLTQEKIQYTELNYGKPSADGIYLKIVKSDWIFLGGTTYQVTYKNMSSGKIDQFKTPGFFKREHLIKYVKEYLFRLDRKANEKNN